jgi:hypothetical protein
MLTGPLAIAHRHHHGNQGNCQTCENCQKHQHGKQGNGNCPCCAKNGTSTEKPAPPTPAPK